MPCYRSDMEGDRKEPMAIQWSANAEEIGSRLRAQGWVDGAELSARSLLSLASPKVSAMALPVLPELNNGVPSLLVFTHPGGTRDERDVLRFWPTDYAIKEQGAASATPVWLGSLVHERLYRASWPINMLSAVDPATAPLAVHDQLPALPGVALLATKDCHGVPVALLTSRSD
ncbi:LssY C-terminal domain-containing protein [Paraburkholderia fungorum]|uniref:LssY C-terminal domain-containing protein n=1 Tax=Paraburkholderia fungorum TaxID=134537 RepID=UPI003877F8A4